MLDHLHLWDFKSHADTRIGLGRFTLLVGPNGCGKSSVLTALQLLSRLPLREFRYVFSGGLSADDVCRRGVDAFALEASGRNGEPWSLRLEAHRVREREGHTWDARLDARTGTPLEAPDRAVAAGWPGPWGTPPMIAEALGDAIYLRLDASRLAKPSHVEAPVPRLGRDGSGLASLIATMKLEHEDRFEAMAEALRRVVPAVRRVRIKRALVEHDIRYRERVDGEWRVVRDVERVVGDEIWFDFVGAPDVPAHAASEGMLIALGLLAMLHAPTRPRLVLLDDLEQALHPLAQQALVGTIRDVLDISPDLQVVATTHSPYLVDAVAPEDVRVLALRPDGVTACRALTDHPDAERALQVLTSGEFLAAEGEAWVAAAEEPEDHPDDE